MRQRVFCGLGVMMTWGVMAPCATLEADDRVPTVKVVESQVVESYRVQRPVTSPLADQAPPTGYRWRTTYVPKTVLETGERDEEVIVRKPVIETAEREETVTVLKPVTERMEREERITVRKPVYETREREETVTVLRPVTETVEQAVQVMVQRPVTTYVWMMTAGGWMQVPQTQYVSQWETRTTPTQTTRYQSQQEVRRVPTQSLRYEEEVQVRKVPVESTRWVEQREVRKVPVTVERIVDQVIVQKKAYSEFKTLYEEKRELVPIGDGMETPAPTTERPATAPRTFREEPATKPSLPANNQQTTLQPPIPLEVYAPLVSVVSPRRQAELDANTPTATATTAR